VVPGSCCCGAVRFALAEPPTMMAQCHCSRCRKLGASVSVFTKAAHFRWTAGEALVARYTPEPPYRYTRAFCSRCGTALGEAGSAADSFPINADTLDADPGVRIRFHEFVGELPPWAAIGDDARRFDAHPVPNSEET